MSDLASYYESEISKERENQDIAYRALMKLIAPANEDQARTLYYEIARSSERQGWLISNQIDLKLREEKVSA